MSLRKQAIGGLIWTFAQQFGSQAISFVVSIILARLLLPEQFGLIGMIMVFIAIGRSLMDSGLTQSLIRNDEIGQIDLSTVFYFNLVASITVYLLIYFLAPFVSEFYDESALTDILRILCLSFIISAFGAVQYARLTKKMDFKTQTIIGLPSTIISGVVGILMAYVGFGVWSLVWSRIVDSLMRTIQLWVYSKWTPNLVFNMSKFKEHFNFGYKLALSGLLDTVFNNIYLIVIGKYFAASQVGFYTRAQTMKKLPVSNISMALNKVTYPLFSTIQNDDLRLKRVYKEIMNMVVFVVSPILIFSAVLAEPIFRILLTEKWVPAVPYFQILCIAGILYPLNSYNLNILKVKGRSDLFLKLEVVKKILIVISIVIAIQFGIYGLLYSQAILALISFLINSHNTNKFINYSSWEQTKDVMPTIFIALLSGFFIYLMNDFLFGKKDADLLRILLGGVTGISIYLGLALVFRSESLKTINNLIFNK